ncbi:MAG TPA: GDSL-type esterase/lipase family protein [Bacilli bacterium]|nr:GDSL-type esterase/lipase family protein [Bacilli bacterium]
MKKTGTGSWLFVSALSIVSAAVLGIGFYLALFPSGQTASDTPQVKANPPAGQPQAQPTAAPTTAAPTTAATTDSSTLQLLALGDSLTKGIGDPEGKGYVGYLKDSLTAHDKRQIVAQNLGVTGLESGQLLRSLQSEGVKPMLQEAGVIVISIGGNDVTHAFGGVEQLVSQGIDEKKVVKAQDEYTKNLQEILTIVRNENQRAPILLLGLYNPFEGVFNDGGQSNRLLLDWNDNLRLTAQAFPNVKVVPMFDLFQWNTDHLLSVDHFHPNQTGYQEMAARLEQALPKN